MAKKKKREKESEKSKKKGGRTPSNKGKASKVRKLIRLAKLRGKKQKKK